MVRIFAIWLILLSGPFICARGQVFAQTGESGNSVATLLYLDGKNITEEVTFPLMKDELLLFEVFDVQPNSEISIITSGAGKNNLNEHLTADPRGAARKVLFFPKNNNQIKCTIKIVTRNGSSRKVIFYLKPA